MAMYPDDTARHTDTLWSLSNGGVRDAGTHKVEGGGYSGILEYPDGCALPDTQGILGTGYFGGAEGY